ncbi:ABC-2 type transport system permease protein [Actinomadura pelletieri DSM 43383]|uniref:ABC-2 type transport system permease protein n=1 Tax=Actinomadura pelletieri DSM 43383 TaxID=1120940 RepID=A0A495QNH9_9ACTN|nr:ABC transporter permease [Actinomadura pelletieri]RKS74540.1 ABC-2 type transport system permease protein [Actinomadura pelletieri DSM 43383]
MNHTAMLRVSRLDLTLLWRNRTAMFSVFGLPLLFAGMLVPMKGQVIGGVDGALLQGTGHLGFFLLFAIFMNLVNVFTARREDLTLKRLRGTALSDAEITGGSIVTATAMYALQVLALVVVLGVALGGRFPADPVLLLVGLAGGVAVFATLAFAISGLTPNAELAQLTVLPIMFGCMLGGGVMFPMDGLPDWLAQLTRLLPLSPVVEISRTGYFGQDFYDHGAHPSVGVLEGWWTCLPSFLVLAVWGALGRVLATRWFRWEPRHA